jgi:hypothetical protein
LEAAGAGSLTEMTTEQRAVFDGFYKSSVERLVREKYDVLADTQMEDLAPTQALVQSTEASLGVSQAAMREFTSFASSGDLQNRDAAPYDAALAAKQSMEAVIPSINNEISRLTRLMANDIYRPNPAQKTEIERQIEVLQDRRSSMQGLLRQYDAGYQRLLVAKAENDAEQARAAEVAETEAQQRRMEAAQVELANTPPGPRGRMPSGLSAEAQELWKERDRLQIEESNSRFFDIFGGGEVSRGRNPGLTGQ